MIKLLAVDMDGTCLNSDGKMSDVTLNALKKAAAAGLIVVPTTGRNLNCLPEKIINEKFYRYAITTNGALAVDLESNKEIFSAFIRNSDAADILRGLKGRSVLTAVNINRRFCIKGPFLYIGVKHVLGKDARKTRMVFDAVKAVEEKDAKIEGIHLFYSSDKHCPVIKELVSRYDDVCVTFARKFAEVCSVRGTKGNALLALGEYLGISADEIACFGDEANDASMFRVVGKSFAMGNAVDEIKNLADVILPTNDENGVAYAIEHYILGGNV